MRGLFTLYFVIGLFALLPGCASLMDSGAQPVRIISEHKDVKATINTPNAHAIATELPTTVYADRSTFRGLHVQINDPCYEPNFATATKTINSYYFLNLLNFYGLGIDLLTGAMWRYDSPLLVNTTPKQNDVCNERFALAAAKSQSNDLDSSTMYQPQLDPYYQQQKLSMREAKQSVEFSLAFTPNTFYDQQKNYKTTEDAWGKSLNLIYRLDDQLQLSLGASTLYFDSSSWNYEDFNNWVDVYLTHQDTFYLSSRYSPVDQAWWHIGLGVGYSRVSQEFFISDSTESHTYHSRLEFSPVFLDFGLQSPGQLYVFLNSHLSLSNFGLGKPNLISENDKTDLISNQSQRERAQRYLRAAEDYNAIQVGFGYRSKNPASVFGIYTIALLLIMPDAFGD